ncbi:MAG: carbohydrate kinase [Propionibacteriaceae bacterium]|jgi:fructokinase|nr:carbohydrate kinase [Propionibacteriaceae bacterium]
MTAPITVVGEVLIDILRSRDGDAVEHVGGSPANVAIGLARLGHPTRLATYFGTDPRGRRIANLMSREGIRLTPPSQQAPRTSAATAALDAAGVAHYEFDLAWHFEAETLNLHRDEHLHTGSIAAAVRPGSAAVLAAVLRAREHSTISYDPNIRPALMGRPDQVLPMVERFVSCSDVVKASEDDVEWLYGETPLPQVLDRWTELGASICAITRGGEAMAVSTLGDHRWFQPPKVAVADTVGAGDSAMAGLLSGLLDAGLLGGTFARERLRSTTWSVVQEAVARSLACAALTVSRSGANPPRRSELPPSAA